MCIDNLLILYTCMDKHIHTGKKNVQPHIQFFSHEVYDNAIKVILYTN